jgi:putative transposase
MKYTKNMPRSNRRDRANETYHIMNRSVGKNQIFVTPDDYLGFIYIIIHALTIAPVRIYSFCIMPNHWHLLVSPYEDGGVGHFMHAITNRHTRVVHTKTETVGFGPLYQGRYKSILIDSDDYFLKVMRYIERNPIRAGLCIKTDEWRWGSSWIRNHGTIEHKKILSENPVEKCEDYKYIYNYIEIPDNDDDLKNIRFSIVKNLPYGRKTWAEKNDRNN